MYDSNPKVCLKCDETSFTEIWIVTYLNASMTTFPLTLWIGSTTTATALSDSASNDCCVLISTPDNQQPNPGCEWYQPINKTNPNILF